MSELSNIDAVAASLKQPPFHHFLEITPLEIDASAGRVVFALPQKTGFGRIADSNQIHGGVISAFIDVTAAYALTVRVGHFVPTINLRIDYLKPAMGALRAEGTVVRAGRTIGVVDVDVTDEDGKQVAVGRGTFGTQPG
jgi:uncharacterized protein (TIGR00369 family)